VPELPEVEIARTLIADQALHRRIVDVDDSDSYVARPHAPGDLRSALAGRSLTAAHRRGKTMWLETAPDGTVSEGGDPNRYNTRPRNPVWNRFTLRFADGGSLVLLDPRRLGRVRLDPDIAALGPDATQVSRAQFRDLITKGTIAVKARLLDQSKIAGIGNLLADEILWQAKVSPLARVNSLTPVQVGRLFRALQKVVDAAIASGGAHTGDMIAARHPGGTCPRDGAPMVHGIVGGRSTWWCSREQALRPDQRPAAET
jgi:formamidopyrimidine-DNA glycosylase